MKKYGLLLIATIGMLTQALAQQPVTVGGVVTSTDNTPLQGATVLLRQPADSQLVKGVTTDPAGRFHLDQIRPGTYLLQVSFITYKTVYRQLLLPPPQSAHPLLKITLSPADTRLKGVTVEARKPVVTNNSEKQTLNIEQSAVAKTRNAFELLKNLPGVVVNKDGDVSIRGKKGVTVMIDGETVTMSAQQLKNLLKATPGSALQSMEVYNNPPASMDGAGNAGVINIVFKNRKAAGFSGSVSAAGGWGSYGKTDQSILLGYGTSKWNYSLNYAHSYDRTWFRDSSYRTYTGEHQEPLQMNQSQYSPEKIRSHLVKLGIDHYLDSKNTLSLNLSFTDSKDNFTGYGSSRYYANPLVLDTLTHQTNTSYSNQREINATLRFKRKINEGSGLTASIHTAQQRLRSGDDFRIHSIYRQWPAGYQQYRNAYPGDVQQYIARTDYYRALPFPGKFETGFKSSFTKLDNRQQWDDLREDKWLTNTVKSNRFRYQEQIHAVYGIVSSKGKKWELSAGLRAEYTILRGDTASYKSLVKQDYLSLLPNVRVGYQVSDKYKVAFQYNRRIERPDYQQLNPAIRYLDPLTIETGNPDLKAQLSHNFEVNQQFLQFIDLAVGYNLASRPLLFSIVQKPGSPYTQLVTQNAENQHTGYASLSFPIPVFKWWENYQSVNVSTSRYQVAAGALLENERATSIGFSSNNTFLLPHQISLELNGWYQGGGLYGNVRFRPIAEINAGISKKLCNDRLNVGVAVSDIFFTNKFRTSVNTPESSNLSFITYESRVVKFTVNWQFGRKKAKTETTTDEDAEQEEKGLPQGKSLRKRD
ncbi:TonB dependent receptor [Chitinophaga nivalis]|uniref:TonB dependent receptor n=1 Tax=Chitinophaga nivalis TaxID=2991709 RepID=A0ABT3IGT6_9BACT|nr:TonB dependent receptor [Chitinophaga nivalis]MCW3467155.1 TonB dependent receptor [Chitinophaga nivalis]MCW3483153.1 TonB dependent receptor [Chitinophaga nivalis]